MADFGVSGKGIAQELHAALGFLDVYIFAVSGTNTNLLPVEALQQS